jgi:hypothetical protein
MNYHYLLLLIISLSHAQHVFSSQRQQYEEKHRSASQLHMYAVPGQNGLPGQGYVERLFNKQQVKITHVATPRWFPDFGQRMCMRLLRKLLKRESDPYGIHASSQATETVLNDIAQHPDDKMRVCILEACMASGNSTIYHTLNRSDSQITKLPYAYYWLPYVAKFLYPFYSPAGKQAIKSVENIRNKGPFVIIHADNDPQTPYEGACALYHGLRKNGNTVYFMRISPEYLQHIFLLDERSTEQNDFLRILKKHQLIHDETLQDVTDKELEKYQPNHELPCYKKAYEELVAKERMHTKIYQRGILPVMATMCAVTTYCAYQYFGGE